MIKLLLGFLLAFGIGAACRYYDLPVPAPPRLLGALLIAAITLGYMGADRLLSARSGNAASGPVQTSQPTSTK